MLNALTSTLPPDVNINTFTGPSNTSPTAIESTVDAVLSSAATFRALLCSPETTEVDAILVACYSAHPLIPMLREELDGIPVLGIMEASLLHARVIAPKFGIIATSQRSKMSHPAAVEGYGMSRFCAGIESCDLGVLDFERLPDAPLKEILSDVSRRLIGQGAEALCLGCAGMSRMKAILQDVVRDEGVQVVDGVEAGVQILSGIVRTGGKSGKRGAWRSSAAARKRRQQDYI